MKPLKIPSKIVADTQWYSKHRLVRSDLADGVLFNFYTIKNNLKDEIYEYTPWCY